MANEISQKLLEATRDWYVNRIIANHRRNSRTFLSEEKLNINPFTVHYLASLVGTPNNPESIARALLYPRILGTSINTSFGQNFQSFIVGQLRTAFGSVVAGMDIEYIDQVDGRRKYSQLKLGTQTINNDDVEPIIDKFKSLLRYARTNSLEIRQEDVVLGVLMGEAKGLSANYRKIEKDWLVIVGRDFWKRLTGDEEVMDSLINTIQDSAKSAASEQWLNDLVGELATKDFIIKLAQ